MNPEGALKVMQELQNVALKSGLFADVNAVNHVSTAIATLQAVILEKASND